MADRIIQLTRGKTTVVDEADYDALASRKWHCSAFGYAIRFTPRPNRRIEWMHRTIMQPPEGFVVDHIDGDKLNNRRSNLRVALHKENCRNQRRRALNTSGHPGVHYVKRIKKWRAAVIVDGHCIYGPSTPDYAAAVADRLDLERKHFGEFAPSLSRPQDVKECPT